MCGMKQILALSHARKSYDGKVVLDDITLAFLPGAKIGVVGPNGMGKSTLLRMMASSEQPSNGEVRLMPGYSTGILPQEPSLDEGKTVLGNVEEGVAGTRALIERYNEVAAKQERGSSYGAGAAHPAPDASGDTEAISAACRTRLLSPGSPVEAAPATVGVTALSSSSQPPSR